MTAASYLILLISACAPTLLQACSCMPIGDTAEERASSYINGTVDWMSMIVTATLVNETSYEIDSNEFYEDDDDDGLYSYDYAYMFTFQNTTFVLNEVLWTYDGDIPDNIMEVQTDGSVHLNFHTETTCCICGFSLSPDDIGKEYLLPISYNSLSSCDGICELEDGGLCSETADELRKAGLGEVDMASWFEVIEDSDDDVPDDIIGSMMTTIPPGTTDTVEFTEVTESSTDATSTTEPLDGTATSTATEAVLEENDTTSWFEAIEEESGVIETTGSMVTTVAPETTAIESTAFTITSMTETEASESPTTRATNQVIASTEMIVQTTEAGLETTPLLEDYDEELMSMSMSMSLSMSISDDTVEYIGILQSSEAMPISNGSLFVVGITVAMQLWL